MIVAEKLPWYETYIRILDGRSDVERQINDIEVPVKKLQRIKKFFENIGADYTKNAYVTQTEAEIAGSEGNSQAELERLKREVRFADALEKAVTKLDEPSIEILKSYMSDDRYGLFIKNDIFFYIGVSMTEKDISYIRKAYDGIYYKYPISDTVRFTDEGQYYYLYYFQCLKSLIRRYRDTEYFNMVCADARERCYNARLMFSSCLNDTYLSYGAKLILGEIQEIEELLNQGGMNQ